MLRAVFVRTLTPGVSYAEFKDAWAPEGRQRLSAIVETTELGGVFVEEFDATSL